MKRIRSPKSKLSGFILSCIRDGAAPSRFIAIRDISDEGILSFTQKITRKINELKNSILRSNEKKLDEPKGLIHLTF